MRWHAEFMNCNSGLPTFGVIALWTLNIAISTIYLCPLSKLKIIWDIYMKFLTNVKHYERWEDVQKLWLTYFRSYHPLNIVNIEMAISTMYSCQFSKLETVSENVRILPATVLIGALRVTIFTINIEIIFYMSLISFSPCWYVYKLLDEWLAV